uniref:Uncharacterized protein n=1 Tax=Glossina brevipalpis TaxID=37001 RepID=A0A1A9W2C6_9MUSC
MSSEKEFADEQNLSEESNQAPMPRKSCRVPRKVIWNPSPEKETFRTVVVNYHFGNRRKSPGSTAKKRDTWSQMVAALNAKKELKAEEERGDVYNLRGLYQMSLDELVTDTSSTICEPRTSKTVMPPVCCKKSVSNEESRQSIKVEIYNMPPRQEVETEEHQKSQLSKSDMSCNRPMISTSNENSKSDSCCTRTTRSVKSDHSSHTVKVEIFNLPPVQEAHVEDIKPKIGQIISQEAEVIVISDEDEEDESTNTKPETSVIGTKSGQQDIVKALKKLAEAAQTTCDICVSASKSTQKPESRIEVPTQTIPSIKMEQKINQMPSMSSSTPKTIGKSTTPTFKQRQLELHRLRVQVEKKRLQLLEMKVEREREESSRERLLFEKELDMRRSLFKNLLDEKDA